MDCCVFARIIPACLIIQQPVYYLHSFVFISRLADGTGVAKLCGEAGKLGSNILLVFHLFVAFPQRGRREIRGKKLICTYVIPTFHTELCHYR
jgi:hypothetical protein